MDPVTQGVLGASVPQSISSKKNVVAATLFGWLSGMAPDLDGLIRSDTDPMIYLEYHRQFSHSLIFIPVGSLICALMSYALLGRRWQLSFKLTYLFCLLGYATHGLLDSCTSYGTQLLWPFSSERVAWNTISIVDPLFTGPLLVLVFLGVKNKAALFGKLAIGWVILYQGLGIYQNHRATEVGYELAAERGHTPLRLEAKPSFGNIVLWKVIYEIEGGYYTDAVRATPTPTVYPGEFIPKLNIQRDLPWLDKDSQQAKDIERFRWFSNGYLALDPDNPARITDMRYSLVPNEATGLWSIWLNPEARKGEHVRFAPDRDTAVPRRGKFSRMLMNPGLEIDF
jgi:inner membrane protein